MTEAVEKPVKKIAGDFPDDMPELHLVGTLNGEHWLDYKVYQVATQVHGPSDKRFSTVRGDDMTPDYDKAEVLFDGFIKWDGCCQGQFDVHVDGRQESVALMTRLFNLIYDAGKEFIPAWDEECAK